METEQLLFQKVSQVQLRMVYLLKVKLLKEKWGWD